ncbi:MAG: hypothetical protein HY706_10255 [Candidatus Hydrogenedentes bacterium]|nr:hypothetical protein [Candidatus Hydrogenedentota bacterium]
MLSAYAKVLSSSEIWLRFPGYNAEEINGDCHYLLSIYLKGCVIRSAFDSKVIAAAETEMWRAYYSGDKKTLASQLLTLERTQFELTWGDSALVTKDLAAAAMKFAESRSGYEEEVLPKLIAAYTRIKAAKGMDFDPETAARAELNWWIARRHPERNSVESVGNAIGALYGVLYGGMKPEFQRAGVLRAEAAALRDAGQENADWKKIEELLNESYDALVAGLQATNRLTGASR